MNVRLIVIDMNCKKKGERKWIESLTYYHEKYYIIIIIFFLQNYNKILRTELFWNEWQFNH